MLTLKSIGIHFIHCQNSEHKFLQIDDIGFAKQLTQSLVPLKQLKSQFLIDNIDFIYIYWIEIAQCL